MRLLCKRHRAAYCFHGPQYRLKSLTVTLAALKLAAMLALILGFSFTFAADQAQAQLAPAEPAPAELLSVEEAPASFVRNRGNPTLYLNTTSYLPSAAAIGTDATEAEWVLEPVPGEAALVHIQNVNTKLNLHTENGILELGIVTPGSPADSWQIEPVAGQLFVRIKSVTTGLYLALQEATGPLSLTPLDLDPAPAGAPPPPEPPATAEWEFIAAPAVTAAAPAIAPLATAAPVAFADVAPFIPETVIVETRSCRGGKVLFRGECECPRDTIDIKDRCRLERFACRGGDVIRGECICPDSRLAVQIGPRELACDRLPNFGFINPLIPSGVDSCNDDFAECRAAGRRMRSCRASRRACLAGGLTSPIAKLTIKGTVIIVD